MSKELLLVTKRVVVDGFSFCFLILTLYLAKIYWEPTKRGFFCDDETIKFPYRPDTISVSVLHIISIGLPIFMFTICEFLILRKQNSQVKVLGVTVPVWIQGLLTVTRSFGLGLLFVEITMTIAKKTIGRPRPHFIDLCKPSVNCDSAQWIGRYIEHNEFTCTGTTDKHLLADMTLSFPSGHSCMSTFGMIYLALYLEKRMQKQGFRSLRYTIQFLFAILGLYISLSRIMDHKHHWSDVLAGYTSGFIIAIIMFFLGTKLVPETRNKEENLHSTEFTDNEIKINNQFVTTC